jgi:hypothetical protein
MSANTLTRAAEMLECEAAILKESYNTLDGDWITCESVRDTHDEMLAVVAELRAMLTASPTPPEAPRWRPGDDIPENVLDATAAAIGAAYDCNRVWAAWQIGTMGPDDFSRVAEDGDRVAEIAGAALEAAHAVLAAPPEQAAQPADVARLVEAIDCRFRSGNGVPVERAVVPAAEWAALRAALAAKGGA